MKNPRIVITSGEPAGIGPDLIISLVTHLEKMSAELLILADTELLQNRANELGVPFSANILDKSQLQSPLSKNELNLIHIPCEEKCISGKLSIANAGYVMSQLDMAIELCLEGLCDAMVTCPIQKSILIEAGYAITGHTEYLAEKTQATKVVMLLANEHLRVALATTHIPLSAVSTAITKQSLIETIEVIDQDLQIKFGIDSPKIYVSGLNPHAGENGHLGKEEQRVIEPALEHLKNQGLDIIGPLPADTMFKLENRKQADVFVAMYHDQGLPVLKALGFGDSVNITLGLPIIRTSVDHGTALDLAGSGKADNRSLLHAIGYALELAKNKNNES